MHLGSSLRVKRLKCEADHSTPSSADLRMIGTIPLLSRTPFTARTAKILHHLNFCWPDKQSNYYLNHCPQSGKHGSKRLITVTTASGDSSVLV
jgi:hypothetical protein